MKMFFVWTLNITFPLSFLDLFDVYSISDNKQQRREKLFVTTNPMSWHHYLAILFIQHTYIHVQANNITLLSVTHFCFHYLIWHMCLYIRLLSDNCIVYFIHMIVSTIWLHCRVASIPRPIPIPRFSMLHIAKGLAFITSYYHYYNYCELSFTKFTILLQHARSVLLWVFVCMMHNYSRHRVGERNNTQTLHM